MTDKPEKYDDMTFVDDMRLRLSEAETLAHLLANYRLGGMSAEHVVKAGSILEDLVRGARGELDRWWALRQADKSGEA